MSARCVTLYHSVFCKVLIVTVFGNMDTCATSTTSTDTMKAFRQMLLSDVEAKSYVRQRGFLCTYSTINLSLITLLQYKHSDSIVAGTQYIQKPLVTTHSSPKIIIMQPLRYN